LGHAAGEALIMAVALRLREAVGVEEMVARLGGGDFAILYAEAKDPAEVSTLARRLIGDLTRPFVIQEHELAIGVSVGVAIYPDDGCDPDLLLKRAGVALHRAKSNGLETECFFEPRMDAQIQRQRSLEFHLRHALEREELELHYQPLVDLSSGEITGCEALLRWRHPELGIVSPADFVPIAEETGLIIPIGEWVLWQACHDAVTWPGKPKIAVNLSTVQFRSAKLVSTVVAALASSGLAPIRLELEVTESVLMQENDENVAILHQLRGLGVRIAMDDFGTGYSSLGYLRRFPFDKIKIDRSFVRDLTTSDECLAIVRAVVGLARGLGLSTTAEGIETDDQLQRLHAEGCVQGQGYLFSRPVPADELKRLMIAKRDAA
jgi:predicted signal transduction protein with EAL and GGDEF domain